MLFTDRATIDGPARITRDGYLVAEARVAKANNIQTYSAGELGLTDRASSEVVRVFRPEAEVFAKDAMASGAHKPVTLDHPREDVTASNWRDYAKGDVGGDVIRDGEFVRVPFKVMDSQAVRAATTTHQEFSLGYSADLDLTPGKFGDAEYDASMKNIRINHLALCDTARGGPELRIVDERPAHLRDHQELPMSKKIMLDGLQVDLSDAAAVEVAIAKLQGQVTDANTAKTTAEAALTTANSTIVARDAEIVTLKDQVEKAKVTPQQMRDAAKSFALTVGKAKAMGVTVTDAMDEATIMRTVVDKAMGDAAKAYTDTDVATAFAVLTKDAKITDTDILRDAIGDQSFNANDSQAIRDRAHQNMILREQGKPEIKA